MATTRTIIDVHNGKLSMTVLGETIQFEVFDVNHVHSDKIDECLLIDEFHGCLDECYDEMLVNDHAAFYDCDNNDFDDIDESWVDALLDDDASITNELSVSAIEQCLVGSHPDESKSSQGSGNEKQCNKGKTLENAKEELKEESQLEMKELPKHLKYAFLGEEGTLPVIIANDLLPEQEEKVVQLLRTYKKAIGWSMHEKCWHQPNNVHAKN